MIYQGHILLDGTREDFRQSDDPVIQQYVNGLPEGPMQI